MGQVRFGRMKVLSQLAAVLGMWLAASSGHAAIEVIVDEFLSPVPVSPVADEWYESDVRPGGTASIVSLVGEGGNLENNQPLPIGAAKLTTDFTNAAKAEVSTYKNFGLASSVLSSIDLAYGYYKEAVAGGNAFAAPSLKLGIFYDGGTGDNYGQLVFEPYWNGSNPPTADLWQSVSIDENTGSGGDGTGGWWWTGGFELPNGAGGAPLRSLAEWVTAFTTSDPSDFALASVVSIGMGVGTFNQGQVGYFDAVSYAIDGGEMVTYNFEPAAVPELSALVTWGLLALSACFSLNRRR